MVSCFNEAIPTSSIILYRVIHKFLQDFRPLRYSSRDGHAEGEHVNRGRERHSPSFCPTLQVLDMSTLGDGTDVIFWQISTHRTLFIPCPLHVSSRLSPSGETCKYATEPSTQKKTWRDSLPIDMLLSAVSVLVVVQLSSEIPEGLMNYPVHVCSNGTVNVAK